MKENKTLTTLGAIAGSLMAILTLLWFIGEPALERYVDSHISAYEERKAEEATHKVKLRHLLGDKMEIADDEVHIELGRMYKKEQTLYITIDSLQEKLNAVERKLAAVRSTSDKNYKESLLNYRDIKKLQKKMDKAEEQHGLFH